MEKEKLDINHVYKWVIQLLKLTGSHPDIPRDKKWLIKYSIPFVIVIICFYVVTYSLICDIIEFNPMEITMNIFMGMVALNMTFKYFILAYYRPQFQDKLRRITEDYELAERSSETERKIVHKYALQAKTVGTIWMGICIQTGMIFPLKSIFYMLYSLYQGEFKLVPMIELSYPAILRADTTFMFWVIWLVHGFYDFLVTTVFMGFEPLGLIFTIHATGQLEVAKHKILNVYSEYQNGNVTEQKFKEIIILMQDVYKFVEEFANFFTVLYEINIKFTTFGVPCGIFVIIESFKRGTPVLEFICFVYGILMHIFWPCLYSDRLMEKGEDVQQAIYACGWEQNPDPRHRKVLLFMQARSAKPPLVRTLFRIYNLETFADMCHSSYAIFNLLTVAMD